MTSALHTLGSLNPDEMQATIEQLKQFRQQLYTSIPYRADATMDLLDALSSNTTAHSVVELSLNPTSTVTRKGLWRHGKLLIQHKHWQIQTDSIKDATSFFWNLVELPQWFRDT